MTDSPKNSQQATALIKFFSKKEHYLAFKKGSSLFRTPHFYRKIEDAGRGDRSESCFGYWDKKLGDELPNMRSDDSSVNFNDIQSILIYPAHEQEDAWLQSGSVIGPFNNFEDSLEQMIKEFGTYFVVLTADKISAYAKLLAKTSGCKVRQGLILYSNNPLERSLVVKDSKFSYQKEFRFFVGACSKVEIQDKKITLQGVNKMLLEANSLQFRSPSGEVKFCSLGHQNVVTTTKGL